MKKTLLTAMIAVLSIAGIASASSDWSILMGDYGSVLYTDVTVQHGIRTQKVGCYSKTNMCYTASEMQRAFKADIQKVEANYIIATGKQPVWKYLSEVIK